MRTEVEIRDGDLAKVQALASDLSFLKGSGDEPVRIETSIGTAVVPASKIVAVLDLLSAVITKIDGSDDEAEVSPQEAAELLRMSRPSVMRLVSSGKLGSRQVGAHYRLSRHEVLSYRNAQATVRRRSLDALSGFTQAYDK